NHDRWHVVGVDPRRGSLDVEHARHHARVRLPAAYVRDHVRLGYASTIASAQGLTVDETHVVVSPGMYASELYTALSRGRHVIHARMHMPEGPERDALDVYSEELNARVREQLDDPTRSVTRRPELTRPVAPEPPGLGIEL